ncbi:ABC transporter ATP-binding protein [Thermodesulforhabdus norvegica]|uniref:Amino acid/amide ABC transporter ATP-binding protein 2, HAAT family n=1 Tax=Thermodesulforhabdus norvegica TaxID=39841 RepID=A0A1I4VSA0_9BACT|nr:ABC transporter ATP-binding protein [Thermodesulforhabdus norvegica]SFN03836.1 amino acid/amide ABC transporter ATP-binding protein 2, HAAT family [Thermodesulforhabdus norvegica]
MLTVKSVHSYYESIHALKGVSLHVLKGEIVTLVGANGAGKSTLVKTICGFLRPSRGEIFFDNRPIHILPVEKIVELGIAVVPEGRQIFASLPVEVNLEMGAFLYRKDREYVQKMKEEMFERFPILRKRRNQLAGTLSGGEQQMLAIARALMSKPKLVILDEPSMGLAPLVVKEVFTIIQELRAEGKTILLIEQNARAALKIADRGYVLETGKVVLEGTGKALLEHSEVQRAYLGRGTPRIWEA